MQINRISVVSSQVFVEIVFWNIKEPKFNHGLFGKQVILLPKALKPFFCSYWSETFHCQLKGSQEYGTGLNLHVRWASGSVKRKSALLFSWNFISMLRTELLRNTMTWLSIFETALLPSFCLNLYVVLLLLGHSQPMLNYLKVRKQASHIK